MASRRGFSLVETLVVLAITAVLLVLVFSVAGRMAQGGFRLAGRSLDAADRRVGTEALRTLVRGVRLPGRRPDAPGFSGGPQGFTAAVVPARATACTGPAPAPEVTVRLSGEGGRTRLVCRAAGGGAAVLLDLGPHPAAFSYALAGRAWTDRLTAAPPPPRRAGDPPPPAPSPQRLWIRLAAADGAFELVEALDPGPAGAGS